MYSVVCVLHVVSGKYVVGMRICLDVCASYVLSLLVVSYCVFVC